MKTKPNEKTGNCILMPEYKICISFEYGISILCMCMKWGLVLCNFELHITEIEGRTTLWMTSY